MRNTHIGLAVAVVIIFVGAYLTRDAVPELRQLVILLAFVAGVWVHHALDDRDLRRKRQ